MASPITGLAAYIPSGGDPSLVFAAGDKLYRWIGSGNSVQLTGITDLSTDDPVTMLQAKDLIYGVDADGRLFKCDETTSTYLPIQDANNTLIEDITDIFYYKGRLWILSGDFVYFSDTVDIETISLPALRAREGAGDTNWRLLEYRENLLALFKGGESGVGSIQLVDTADNDPDNFGIFPLYQGADISLMSPRAIVRVGSSITSDILYLTREGVRPLHYTDLNILTGPNLPLSENVRPFLKNMNQTRQNRVHAVVFDDELLLWMPTGTNARPDMILADTFKVPKDDLQQGWTRITNGNSLVSSTAIISFRGRAKLWGGGNDGELLELFAQKDDSEFLEVSRLNTHSNDSVGNLANHDKVPFELVVSSEFGAEGVITASIVYQDTSEHIMGSRDIGSGGFPIPFDIPFDIPEGSIKTSFFPLHADIDNVPLLRYKAASVKIVSTDQPKILGWELQSFPEKLRYKELNEPQAENSSTGVLQDDSVTAGTL